MANFQIGDCLRVTTQNWKDVPYGTEGSVVAIRPTMEESSITHEWYRVVYYSLYVVDSGNWSSRRVEVREDLLARVEDDAATQPRIEFCLMNPRNERVNMVGPDTVREYLRGHKGTRYNVYLRRRDKDGRRGASWGGAEVRSVADFDVWLASDNYRNAAESAMKMSTEPSRCEAAHWLNQARR